MNLTTTTKLQQAYDDLQKVLENRSWLLSSAKEAEGKAKTFTELATERRTLAEATHPEEARLRKLIAYLVETNNKDSVQRHDDMLRKKARLEAELRALEAQL